MPITTLKLQASVFIKKIIVPQKVLMWLKSFKDLSSNILKSVSPRLLPKVFVQMFHSDIIILSIGGAAIRGGQRFASFYCTSFKTNICVDTEGAL